MRHMRTQGLTVGQTVPTIRLGHTTASGIAVMDFGVPVKGKENDGRGEGPERSTARVMVQRGRAAAHQRDQNASTDPT